MGGPRVPPDGDPGRSRGRLRQRLLLAAPAPLHGHGAIRRPAQLRDRGPRPPRRFRGLGTDRGDRAAARGPPQHRKLGVGIGGDRWGSGLRVLRLTRPLLLRHGRESTVGIATSATCGFAWGSARAPRRRSTAMAIVVVWDHEGQSFITSLDKRTGAELWRTDRDESTSWSTPLVGGACRRRPGGHQRDGRRARLRLRDRRAAVGRRGGDDQRHSVTGRRRGHRLPDERVSRQPALCRRPLVGARRPLARRGHRLVPGSRHALRAVPGRARRHPVLHEEQLRHPLGLRRRQRGEPVRSGAAVRDSRRVRFAGRRRRPAVRHEPGTARRWSPGRAPSSRSCR